MGLVLRAPAKVNLFLEVIGRRPDGYHEIETVMHAVDLADELEFTPAEEIEVVCDSDDVPTGRDNLVWAAAHLLRAETGVDAGAVIRLRKRIPIESGLGGGSSDAAAALLGLSSLWQLRLDRARLADIAARLGSDVPFFLWRGTALCTGRGEQVTPLPCPRALHFILLLPEVSVSTARVYGSTSRLTSPRKLGTFNRLALESGDFPALGKALFNRLEETTFRLYPQLEAMKGKLAELPLDGVLMSGSGSCIFGLCRTVADATRWADALSDGSIRCVAASSYGGDDILSE